MTGLGCIVRLISPRKHTKNNTKYKVLFSFLCVVIQTIPTFLSRNTRTVHSDNQKKLTFQPQPKQFFTFFFFSSSSHNDSELKNQLLGHKRKRAYSSALWFMEVNKQHCFQHWAAVDRKDTYCTKDYCYQRSQLVTFFFYFPHSLRRRSKEIYKQSMPCVIPRLWATHKPSCYITFPFDKILKNRNLVAIWIYRTVVC